MGGFLGIGGSSAKTDRAQTLQGYSDLSNVFNFGLDTAKAGSAAGAATTGAGISALSQPLQYWQNILSGNRTSMNAAIAPEKNAIQSQGDAQRRQQAALGTARGGGTSAANQQQQTNQMAQVDNALLQARPEAAKETANIGGELAQVGNAQTAEALNALGIGSTAASNLTADSINSRPTSQQINQQTVGNVVNAISAGLSLIA
jgi:hypothetical protein